MITSDDIFKRIDERSKHNSKALSEIDEARNKQDEILNNGYLFKGNNDHDNLLKLLEARKLSKTKFARVHASSKEKMSSNG